MSDREDAFSLAMYMDAPKGIRPRGKSFANEVWSRIAEQMIFQPLVLRPGQIQFIGADMGITETKKAGKPEKFNTIGVRFPESPGKEYTYKVRIGAKPYLGQELVADTPRGQAVVFVTRIDKKPMSADSRFETSTCGVVGLKWIERKAVAL